MMDAFESFHNQKSFTLTEIMIVVVITSMIAVFAIPNFNKTLEKQLERDAFLKVRTLHGAMEVYKSRHGQYPTNGTALNDIDVINSTLGIKMVEDPFNVSCAADGSAYYCCASAHEGKPNLWRLCYQTDPPIVGGPPGVLYCSSGAGPCPTCAFAGCGTI